MTFFTQTSACVVVGDLGYFVESSNDAIEVKKIVTSFYRHVVLPGTPEHGTPEHRNTGTSRNIPEHPKTRNTPKKPGTLPRKPGTPQENPEHPGKKPRNLKKQMYRQYVTARVSFSKLPPLITHKII